MLLVQGDKVGNKANISLTSEIVAHTASCHIALTLLSEIKNIQNKQQKH